MRRPGPLGARLVLAFSLVSLISVTLLALAAQLAVDRGLRAARASGMWDVATQAATAAARAYREADGWAGADLSAVEAVAAGADRTTSLTLTDADGTMLLGSGDGRGQAVSAAVQVDGTTVGTVVVRAPGAGLAESAGAEARGRQLAWSWIVAAAGVALGLAVGAGWAVTRWLTGPLRELADVARGFARGDHAIRARPTGAGEIADLAHGFNEAADAVEASAAARRQMAADVAHELRTPLGALQAGLEELRDGLVPADPQTLARLHDQSVRLSRVVADLGVLAEANDVGPGRTPGRTDLARLVREELEARGPELRAAGVAVRGVELAAVTVRADADRLHQVVGNLLANCARHCRPGDHVDVALVAERGDAVLVVADDGPGIPEADLPRVFDRYWRGGRADVPGSGLGLAVVREIVRASGGTITLTSEAGTRVVVRLPHA
jgi:two-component system sensor histidine kinase BaeS